MQIHKWIEALRNALYAPALIMVHTVSEKRNSALWLNTKTCVVYFELHTGLNLAEL